jgi:type IV secretion system protein TrbB
VTAHREALRVYLGEPTLRLLDDPLVSEIYTNDDLVLRTDGSGGRRMHSIIYDESHLLAFFRALAVTHGSDLDEAHPIGDFELPAELGSGRLHVKLPPITKKPNFNLRKPAARLLLLPDLVAAGSLPQEAADYLTQCLAARKSILVAGPTNSGKTNFLNALLDVSVKVNPPNSRYVVIEDVPEIRCPAADTQYCRTTETVTLWDLVRATMRSSPDQIVVGELRGEEAYPFLDIASSGHGGVFASIHAETPRGALQRLNRLAKRGNADIPDQHDLIAEVIRVLVCLTGGSRGRRVTSIAEVRSWTREEGFSIVTPPALAGFFEGASS